MQSILVSLSQDGVSHLFNLNGSNPIISFALLSKPVAIEPQLSSGAADRVLPQVEQLGAAQSNHGMINLKNIGKENDSLSLPYAASNFTSASSTNFPLNSNMTTSSCVDESSYLQSSENVDQVNPPTRTFVKVHKSGSFGCSFDISKFSSYDELRYELARMFGLEGQLEDPQRSGWQLIFGDQENDILLLGDDPWQ